MIYLDNAATSFPKPFCVKDAICDFMDNIGANSGRSAYKSAIQSSKISYDTKRALGEFIGANAQRIFWTYNATYAINIALRGLLKRKDKILISPLEHNALMRPLHFLARELDLEILTIPANKFCELDLKEAKKRARGAKMIICVAANNVTGSILPLDSLKQIAREENAALFVDAAQILGVYPFKMDGIDIVCGSAHKGLMSIMGLGFCAFSENVDFEPLIFGGTGSLSDSFNQPRTLPDRFESGTQNMHAIAGLKASLKWINDFGVEQIHKKEREYIEFLEQNLREIKGIELCEVRGKRVGILSFRCANISKMARELSEKFDICVRAGLHCSIATHKILGNLSAQNSGAIRVSVGALNTQSEIEAAIGAIRSLAQ